MPKPKKQPATAETKQNANAGRIEPSTAKVSFITLSALSGLAVSTLQGIVGKAGILNDKGMLLRECFVAIVNHYKGLSEAESSEKAKDSARREKADADSAEIKRDREIGLLVSKDGMRRKVEACFVEVREQVRKMDLPGFTLEHKKAVCEVIATAKVKEEE